MAISRHLFHNIRRSTRHTGKCNPCKYNRASVQ